MSMTFSSVHDYLTHVSGNLPDICADVYFLFLKGNQHAPDNLAHFLEQWDNKESDDTITVKSYYSDEEYKGCYESILGLIDRIHSNLVEENNAPAVFYSKLWANISNTAIFTSDLDTICAILYVLTSPLTPYFVMDEALSMSNDMFRSITQKIENEVKKAIFAMNRNYTQRTQVASQIVAIFDQIHDYKERIVYAAHLIGYSQYKIQKLNAEIEQLKEKNLDN